MRRLLCIFLILSLLVAYIPATSASEEKAIPYSLLENAAKKISADTDFSKYSAKRGNDYSYGIPAPLSDGQAAVVGLKLPIAYIMIENGGANQAMYTLVYKGDSSILDDPNFDEDPVAYSVSKFSTSTTPREHTVWFNTQGCQTGTYTVLSFTMVNDSQLVEASSYYTEVYVVDKAIPLQRFILKDAETDKEVTALNLCYLDEKAYTIGRVPAITTDTTQPRCYTEGGTGIEVQEYHGLVYLYASALGSSTLNIHSDTHKLSLPASICFDTEGHKYQSEHVRDASKSADGVTICSCEKCYYAYVQYDNNLSTVFTNFKDVPAREWYTAEVQKAVEMGLFNGLSTEKFAPGETMTRAMLVTVLWRYAGKPAAETFTDFSDVPKGQWYSDAVAWAAEKGIVTGVGHGRFAPNDTITREQMATILYRYATQLELDTSTRAELSQFDDAHLINAWAKDALQWAVAEGIIGGSVSNGILSVLPANGATRAQVAAVLVRTIEKLLTSYYEIELPDCAIKAQGATKKLLWYVYEDGTLVIETNTDTPVTDTSWQSYKNEIKILKVLQGIETVDSFQNMPALKEVILADSVDTIAAEAFKNCTALEVIRFPDGLGYIDYSAFQNCSSLKTLQLPKDLYYLGWACFADCTGLTELRLPDGFRLNTYSGMNGQGSFKNCTSLEKVILGKGSSTISYNMFYGCTALTTIEFATGIHSLGSEAFGACGALEELVLPEQLQSFQDNAFAECSSLKKVIILNPCLQILSFTTDSAGNPTYNTPFPAGCEIYGYTGSTAEAIAEYFGYSFHPIDK